MASIAAIARIFQITIVMVFPLMSNLKFFLKFAENVYHREKPKCICLKKKLKQLSSSSKKKLNYCLIDKTIFR